MIWGVDSGVYRAKSLVGLSSDKRRSEKDLGIVRFPVKKIWGNIVVPPKVASFLLLDSHKGKSINDG